MLLSEEEEIGCTEDKGPNGTRCGHKRVASLHSALQSLGCRLYAMILGVVHCLW